MSSSARCSWRHARRRVCELSVTSKRYAPVNFAFATCAHTPTDRQTTQQPRVRNGSALQGAVVRGPPGDSQRDGLASTFTGWCGQQRLQNATLLWIQAADRRRRATSDSPNAQYGDQQIRTYCGGDGGERVRECPEATRCCAAVNVCGPRGTDWRALWGRQPEVPHSNIMNRA